MKTKGYLRVKNFWHYQNADAWKKAQESQRGHPIWFKHFVHRDLEMDLLPAEARLLWYELLGIATRYANGFPNDSEWIANESRMSVRVVRQMLPLLVKGAWLSETRTLRRSRFPLEKALDQKKKKINPPNPPSGMQVKCPECGVAYKTEARVAEHRRLVHDIEPIEGRAVA